MSTLSNLLRQVRQKDPQLAADLEREVKALEKRRAFGLNFERHVPETVELPGRPVRRGNKVRFVAERGEPTSSVDERLWTVARVRHENTRRMAGLACKLSLNAVSSSVGTASDGLVVSSAVRHTWWPSLAGLAYRSL